MQKITLWISAVVAMLLGFAGTAYAAGAIEDGSVTDMAKVLYEAIKGGQYAYAACMALIVGVALVKRYGAKRYPWLNGDVGGSLLVLVGSFAGALGTALAGGGAVTWGLMWAAGGVAVSAAGGYALIKKLFVEPVLRPLVDKAPAWLKPILMMVMWVFDKAPDPVGDAVAAGDAAVKAAPGEGIRVVTGDAKEVK